MGLIKQQVSSNGKARKRRVSLRKGERVRFDNESKRSPDGYVKYFGAQGATPAAIQQPAKAR
jgi:hypothetical protein